MAPGIRGEAPFTGSPTPNVCPGCGDRLFSINPGHLKCEICGAEVNVEKVEEAEPLLTLQDSRGGQDLGDVPAAPARATRTFQRQRRKTGNLSIIGT